MNVFISWSGPLAKAVGELLHSWIKCVLQSTRPFISTSDIDKGSIWFGDIGDRLNDSSTGIICVTQENQAAPWLLFEAGALSKGLSQNRVCTFLIDLGASQLTQPLASFNATLPNKEDLKKLISGINVRTGAAALPPDVFNATFDMWWLDFEAKFQSTITQHKTHSTKTKRAGDEMLAEVLEICRGIQSNVRKLSIFDGPSSHYVSYAVPRNVLSEQEIRRRIMTLQTQRNEVMMAVAASGHPIASHQMAEAEELDRLIDGLTRSLTGESP